MCRCGISNLQGNADALPRQNSAGLSQGQAATPALARWRFCECVLFFIHLQMLIGTCRGSMIHAPKLHNLKLWRRPVFFNTFN